MAAVLGSIAGAFIGDKLFGAGKTRKKAVAAADPRRGLLPFTGGGLSASYVGGTKKQPGRLLLAPSAERTGLIGDLSGTFLRQSGEYAGLRPLIRPGFGELTRTRVQALQNARIRTIGDLRETFAQRRMQGSSFAQDTLARAELEFAEKEAELRASSFLEELQLTTEMIGKEYQARSASYAAKIQDLNMQADVAVKLISSGQGVIADMAKTQAVMYVDLADYRESLATIPAMSGSPAGSISSTIGGSQTIGSMLQYLGLG